MFSSILKFFFFFLYLCTLQAQETKMRQKRMVRIKAPTKIPSTFFGTEGRLNALHSMPYNLPFKSSQDFSVQSLSLSNSSLNVPPKTVSKLRQKVASNSQSFELNSHQDLSTGYIQTFGAEEREKEARKIRTYIETLKSKSDHHYTDKENSLIGLGMSFSGCGFMSAYHFGVVAAFQADGKRLLSLMTHFSGASAGSLIASLLALRQSPDTFIRARKELFKVAGEINQRGFLETLKALVPDFSHLLVALKVFNPKVNYDKEPFALAEKLNKILSKFIPEDPVKELKSKLFVSVTRAPTPGKKKANKIICKFDSKKKLVNSLLASCHIPVGVYMGAPPPVIENEKCFDGGWSNNLPVFDKVPTITVSPFSGPVSIGPDHQIKPGFQTNGQAFYGDFDNVARGLTALFPTQELLNEYYKEGLKDGKDFLNKNNFNDEHESMQHIKITEWSN